MTAITPPETRDILLQLEDGILVNTFCTSDLAGSPQHLHFFSTVARAAAYHQNNPITDEHDHSYIYFASGLAYVTWANKTGLIQLCGSAGYALVYLLDKYCGISSLTLRSSHQDIVGYRVGEKTVLSIPAKTVKLHTTLVENKLYGNEDSGIYLLELAEQATLADTNYIQHLIQAIPADDIHGLCAYFWDNAYKQGELRYFVPRYGRNEDYVTGSIHSYLTPLIKKQTQINRQHWRQLSACGGEIFTKKVGAKVTLSGQCQISSSEKLPLLYGALRRMYAASL